MLQLFSDNFRVHRKASNSKNQKYYLDAKYFAVRNFCGTSINIFQKKTVFFVKHLHRVQPPWCTKIFHKALVTYECVPERERKREREKERKRERERERERESEIYERLFFEMLIVIVKGKKVQYKTYNTNKN